MNCVLFAKCIKFSVKKNKKQECISVGCIPPAVVAVWGGLHQAPPCYGLLVWWPSVMAFWPPQKTIPEGHLQSEGHQTRRA